MTPYDLDGGPGPSAQPEVGYPRDASWWPRPDVRSDKRLHRVGADGLMAACDSRRVMLCTDMPREVTATNRCRRCFREVAS